MIRYREFKNASFAQIFRIYISGSSSAGKTYFARQLLNTKLLNYERVYYYHPDFHEHAPVEWDKSLGKQVFYQAGLPSLDEILELPEYSCLVFDDLFSQCCESKDIDYLFRVLSSKRNLNCIIMTQRYFAEGKNRLGLSIRNSCNYHVLMNNADARTNINVANSMQLKPEITRATEENKYKLYPYIFLDKTNQARVNGLQVYTDIFGRYKEVICGSMKFYLLSESDFKANFKVTDGNCAESKYENKKRKRNVNDSSEEEEENTNNFQYYSSSSQESTSSSSDSNDSDGDEQQGSQRRRIEKTVARALRKYKIRSELFGKNH